jgi:hypothetical protein
MFPGIRWFPSLGVHTGAQPWQTDPSFVQDFYDRFAAPKETKWFLTTPRYWFTAEKKINWRAFLVDDNKAPVSHKQARNPAWSNYKWNHNDVLGDMLKAPCVVGNKAKLGIFVAMTATAEQRPVPRWMIDKGLTWRERDGKVHVRQDLEEGWRYMADFLVALVKKYGDNRGLASLVIGEYYPGQVGARPANFDFDAFRANAKKIWADVISNAPKDKNGNRLNILQSNPIITGGHVTAADIAHLKLGLTDSDPHLFINGCGEVGDVLCEAGSLDRARQDLYGVVPLQHQGNTNSFENGGDPIVWTGIENPFGFTRGQTVNLKLEHAAWYYGSKGVIPLNSLLIKDSPVLTDDWFPAFDRFGPNGTHSVRWGQLPNSLPAMKPREQ